MSIRYFGEATEQWKAWEMRLSNFRFWPISDYIPTAHFGPNRQSPARERRLRLIARCPLDTQIALHFCSHRVPPRWDLVRLPPPKSTVMNHSRRLVAQAG